MIHRASLAFFCVVLAGCGLRDMPPAPLLSIADGRYAGVVEGACLTLEFGRRDRQTFIQDANCDGQPELQSAFAVEENVIRTDAGSLVVTAVGGASFSGTWVLGAVETPTRFERVTGQ